ncbi:MAG TPA: cell division protein FtsZ, partial [Solirubrobacteraceae bacterium]|nr:cell division protein FtsZ [Solirubrobacteraceae bacterium]
MANAKRASMREGPLAALFRKTEAGEGEAAEAGAPGEPARSDAPATGERSAAPRAEAAPAPERPQATPRERSLPHPALSAPADAPAEPARIPSPQERLRQAFSSEIPENVMERQPARPVMDDYSRQHPESFGTAGPAGQPVIRVVGVGGAGVNAVNRMVEAEVEGVEFLAVNTDMQSLQQSTADITLHIGAELTRGLGAGSDANVGRQSAMEDYDRLKALLKGSDMIFITAGAGGGTGTGAAPIVARIAREVGALTVAIVTKPFGFEGSRRSGQAEQGVETLAAEVDTLIVVPNNRLLSVLDKQTAMVEAFRVA